MLWAAARVWLIEKGSANRRGPKLLSCRGRGGGKILSYATAGKVRAMGDVKDREEMDQMG